MVRATVDIENGVVVAVHRESTVMPTLVGGEPIYDFLKRVKVEGWEPDGELPPFRQTGKYSFPISKREEPS
jgi:hypothetical protein